MELRLHQYLLIILLGFGQFAFAGEGQKDESQARSNQTAIQQLDANENGKAKNCVMVCERWGEDCVINPRTGTKKCRRTCKEMGQECF